jgi:hypothetical protein
MKSKEENRRKSRREFLADLARGAEESEPPAQLPAGQERLPAEPFVARAEVPA